MAKVSPNPPQDLEVENIDWAAQDPIETPRAPPPPVAAPQDTVSQPVATTAAEKDGGGAATTQPAPPLRGWGVARNAMLTAAREEPTAQDRLREAVEDHVAKELHPERLGNRMAKNAKGLARRMLKDTSSRQDPESPGGSRPGSAKGSQPLQTLINLDVRGKDADGLGTFGSIRFLAAPRAQPSKFVRLASSVDFSDPMASLFYARHVVDLALKTWKLPPPCAMISMPHSGGSGLTGTKVAVNSRLELVLRRGIAEAARKTGAWIFTSGDATDASARVAGRAMLHVANEYGDSERQPTIGVLPWVTCAESSALGKMPNGYCQTYAATRSNEAAAERRMAVKEISQTHGVPALELDANHSHFLLVDGDDLSAATKLRGTVEKYISDTDISRDSIQTPKVLLVVGGSASSFRQIADQLDPFDPATGTAVPVLVIAGSGGAAEDIWNYYDTGALPEVDEHRDAEYASLAARWLPRIKELGQLTGQNEHPQLAFFHLTDDIEERDDLAVEIQKAMLNDCPNVKEEALLAVKWKEPVILQQHLQDHAQDLLARRKKEPPERTSNADGGADADDDDDAAPMNEVDLLQVALTRVGGADVSVVRTILSYIPEPVNVTMDELFHKSFNRYPVEETNGKWAGSRRKKGLALPIGAIGGGIGAIGGGIGAIGGGIGGAMQQGRSLSKMATSMMDVTRPSQAAARPSQADGDGDGETAQRPSLTEASVTRPSFSGVGNMLKRVGSRSSMTDDALETGKWAAAAQVLSAMVDGYEAHLAARRELDEQGGLKPNWTDLMMWAVLSGQHELAEALWEKTTDPIRAALMASQLCRRLTQDPALRADYDELDAAGTRYEDCALELLDAVRESSDAGQLISLIPWSYAQEGGPNGEVTRKLLWEASALESAAEEDGLLSVPCMRFISHRHSQYLIDKHFVGDYPGSKARVPMDGSSLLRLLVQSLLPLFPGTVVEVMAAVEQANVACSGKEVRKDREQEQGEDGLAVDPDLLDVLEELRKAKAKEDVSLLECRPQRSAPSLSR